MRDVAAVILAAGRGQRFGGKKPKALAELHGRTLISRVVETVRQAGIEKTIVVVGFGADQVRRHVGGGVDYAHQHRLLGNGHALSVGLRQLPRSTPTVLSLHVDSAALYPASLLRRIVQRHALARADVTVAVRPVTTFRGTAGIATDDRGRLVAVEERHDPLAPRVHTVNVGLYVFRAGWIRSIITRIVRAPSSNERGLSRVINIASARKARLVFYRIRDTSVGLNINTPADLQRAHRAIKRARRN